MIISAHLHCDGRRNYDCINQVSTQYIGHALPADILTHLTDAASCQNWTLGPVETSQGERTQAWCPACNQRRVQFDDQVLCDLLLLVNIAVTPATVASWTSDQREQASEWAAREHLSASDNPVRRIHKPEFLP